MQKFNHNVVIKLDDNRTLYKLLMWCGKQISPNYNLWHYEVVSDVKDVVKFKFVHAQDACEFSLTWS